MRNLIYIPVALMPMELASAAARLVFDRILSRHPSIFDRMGGFANASFCFMPDDLPLQFVSCPAKRRIDAFRKGAAVRSDVTVQAPLRILLMLLQGHADGDALFFSRSIQVSGDMEALLALRNALDDSRIDLLADVFGKDSPLVPLIRPVADRLFKT